MSSMPNDTYKIFAKVFSKLPQRVVWKWETDIPEGVSSNVFMANWIPQQDLLGNISSSYYDL